MKLIKLVSLGIAGIFFFEGCAKRELVFKQQGLCQAPIVDIHLQSVYQKNGQSATDEANFEKMLRRIIEDTGCIRLVNTPQEGTYTLNATYEINIEDHTVKESLKSATDNILSAKVVLNFNNKEMIRRDFGEAKVSTKENKILGIGESEQISREDEIKALQGSILAALKNFISATQAKQELQIQETDDGYHQDSDINP